MFFERETTEQKMDKIDLKVDQLSKEMDDLDELAVGGSSLFFCRKLGADERIASRARGEFAEEVIDDKRSFEAEEIVC
jgi:hypothetical protein